MTSPIISSELSARPPAPPERLAKPFEGAPVVIEASMIGKRYEMHRHRTILLKNIWTAATGQATKNYFWALRDVSFAIRKGETVGILGANGAGKSTLLTLVAKTARATRGELSVQGRIAALLELGAGFHPDFTGRENILINGCITGLTKAQMMERMEGIIAFSELGPFIDEPLRNYSSGMMARLGFSVATAVDPDILIIDEVLGVGDQAFQGKCLARLKEFQERGCTIVYVSHSTSSVKALCDRAILISHGKILADGPAREVCDDYSRRSAEQALEVAESPYETSKIPLWRRLAALVTLAAMIGSIGYVGWRYVLKRSGEKLDPPAGSRLNAVQAPAGGESAPASNDEPSADQAK